MWSRPTQVTGYAEEVIEGTPPMGKISAKVY